MYLNRNLLKNRKGFKILLNRNYSTKHNSSNVIRQQFLDFFIKDNQHEFVKSSSVIPFCDKTLSFTNSGMNQFKNIFLGYQKPAYPKVANTQKCIRVGGKHNDLSIVGSDSYHHTFFEMLGNWSFGDYFKKEACEMAYKLLTEVYKISPDRLYVTYFSGDAENNLDPDLECRDIWLNIGVKKDRIIGFGMKDNFWEMGKSGPCGPCTEIHIDHLPTFDSVNRGYDVNMDKSDLTEIWNIVFIQNYRRNDGKIENLQEKFIDTGMGFERLVAFLQGKSSNYDSDLFMPLFKKIEKITHSAPYTGSFSGDDFKRDTSYRILADHSRMIAVCLADGMFPEQNQKLRRILRKCINISVKHFGHQNLMIETVPVVANILGDTFPELHQKLFNSLEILKYEEEYFQSLKDSLSKGIKEIINQNPKLNDLDLFEYPGFVPAYQDFNKYKKSNKKEISGEMAFKLHSTYGLDIDLIEKLAETENMTVDIDGYEDHMEQMKNKLLESVDGEKAITLNDLILSTQNDLKYEYSYDTSKHLFCTKPVQTKILALFDGNGSQIDSSVDAKTSSIRVVTESSPFYYESGGQESDSGYLIKNGQQNRVNSVTSQKERVFHSIHHDSKEVITVGDSVELKIDDTKRTACTRNHSATHIINAVIRQLKKLPIYQKSSLVTSNQLKIELAMIGPKLSEIDVRNIEEAVQKVIRNESLDRKIEIVNSQQLQKQLDKIVMVPGEIYPDDNLRIISFGDLSTELCCGSHVHNTNQIEDFTFSSVKSTGRTSYLFTGLTANAARRAIQKGDEVIDELNKLKEVASLDNFNETLSNVRRISTELMSMEISYLKKLECLKLIEAIKDQIKNESRSAVSELLDIEMKAVSDKNKDSKFIVHFLTCSELMKNVSLQKATRLIDDQKPVIIVSYVDDEVKARCCVPQQLINEKFDAEKWLKSFADNLKSKVEPPKGQNKLEVCFMKGRKVKADLFDSMLQTATKSAEKFASENC
ncbi:alanine--tRNA ligase, mitochondrial [Chironomus tepperi]|uniref:alanine--tRNA ligase, mitochondrial n=1 Tax=Chironomus tepperi TaxID=113505 RepID=UPI00391FBEFE